jgi:AP2 domain
MKEILLTQGRVAFVDDEDYIAVMEAGSWYARLDKGHWYATRSIRLADGRQTSQTMHRFIMGIGFGDPLRVDHKDRINTLDNRKSNLRIASVVQNSWNSGIPKHNTSGVKGVSWNEQSGKWRAQIKVNGKQIYLGLFTTLDAARDAYDAAVLKYHGSEFGVTNQMLAAA